MLISGAMAAVASACGSVTQVVRPQPLCREAAASPHYRQAIATVRPLLGRLRAGLRAPGLGLAVAADGKIVWSVSCGYADLKSRRRVTAHTLFRIGSVSKALTATALADYAETGRVDLDVPIDRYVDFPSHGGTITLRRLAGHLAGIRHYQTRAEAVNRRHFATIADTLALFAHDPLVAEPGMRFSYSSYGYDVIGAAIERVSGLDFATLMRKSVLARAGMRETLLATRAESKAGDVLRTEGRRRCPSRPADRPQRPAAGRRLPLDLQRRSPLRRRLDERKARQPPEREHDVHFATDDGRRRNRLRLGLRATPEPIRVVRRPNRCRRRWHRGIVDPREDRDRAVADD
jgi:CubicO group peptidase (beta-lactamase class C family)